uniref:Retrovirus-related Pol polyprotein from transposon TNT 1-94-like beta-barrel domain-containing protein n=1 Tax=Cajanus cajan TaxID=3821 RepID=A0A151RA16_CAJCA|nr:hypothetical protein KK1_039360 [Cajanus cajan]
MTGDPSKFSALKMKHEGFATYKDNDKGKIHGCSNISITPSTLIESVLLVEELKHNLLSISQLCDRGFKVVFDNNCCMISDNSTNEIKFIGRRI